jgi:hypothetical protein
MTPAENFIDFLVKTIPNLSIWLLVKILFIFGLFLYLAFAVIVIRQVGLMGKTLDGEFNLPLKFIAWTHLIISLGVFLLAIFIL